MLDDDNIKRFRSRYREQFGAAATQDPLYEAVSDGRRLAGMEHWLPLFEERLVTLFDHLSPDDAMVIDNAAIPAGEERLSDIADYREARTNATGQAKGGYRPLDAETLYLGQAEWQRALLAVPIHRTVIFAEPESESVLDFGFNSARDFAPERARGDNIYESAAKHLGALAKIKKRSILATYSEGSRSRISSILSLSLIHI